MRPKHSAGEQGQEIVLFGVMLAMVVAVGSVLAINLVWLRAEWTALQEGAISATAAGALEVQGLPGVHTLDPDRAESATRRMLEANLEPLPFLGRRPSDIAADAIVTVTNPALADPYVELEVGIPIRLPWTGWELTLPIHAFAEAGQSPQ